MANFLRGIAGTVGKAIPNEIGKLNAFSNLLNFIPGIGPVLSTAVKATAAIDAGATAYGDSGNLSAGFQAAAPALSGRSVDPSRYGSGPDYRPDTLAKVGSYGNYAAPFFPSGAPGGLPANAGIAMPGEMFQGEMGQGSSDYFKRMLPFLIQMAGVQDQDPNQDPVRRRRQPQYSGLLEYDPNDGYQGPFRGDAVGGFTGVTA